MVSDETCTLEIDLVDRGSGLFYGWPGFPSIAHPIERVRSRLLQFLKYKYIPKMFIVYTYTFGYFLIYPQGHIMSETDNHVT